MKITHVHASGFKGRSFQHALKPMNLIVGENAAGKTAVVDAIRLALLGYDPRIPKKKADIYAALGSAPTMSVNVMFDTKKENIVNLRLKGEKVTGTIETNIEFPPVLLDSREYFSLSRSDRVRFLLERSVGADQIDVLKNLNNRIEMLGGQVADEERRKKDYEAANAADAEQAINEAAPAAVDLAKEIAELQKTIREQTARHSNLRLEYQQADSAVAELERLKMQRVQAGDRAPAPRCEHCGQTVLSLKSAAVDSFRAAISQAELRIQGMRPKAIIAEEGREVGTWLEQANVSLEGMRSAQGAWEVYANKRRAQEQRQALLEQTKERLEKARTELKEYEEKKKDLLAMAVKPLLEKANMFFDPVMGRSLVWDDGVIGYMQGTKLVPFSVFSGSEELLSLCGFCVALAQSSPCRLVVMDELGRLSYATKNKLLNTIKVLLQKDVIDQWIGIDTTTHGYPVSDANVIEVAQ